MSKVCVLYKIRKEEIYSYYNRCDKLDNDIIIEINDHITDSLLSIENFKNELEEFFITVSMCMYMIEHDLYDEYFFSAFKDILEDYDEIKDDFLSENDKELFESDMETVKDYLKKEESNKVYYDVLSSVFEQEINGQQ